MQAVILAAGLGTRMGSLTKERPKPLLTIENRTLLEHNLLALPKEIDEVVLVVGYLKDQVMAAVGQEFLGKKIRYVVQEELLGTGHALSQCKDVLCGRFLR
ncbi:MAG: NTP transferase domain-containing protein, partial [Patescibacteria group bacterium]|nr:NTP transferase domain-containing protein [Patescibacteria group bacterium]